MPDKKINVYIVLVVLLAAFVMIYADLFTGEKTFVHDTINWAGIFYYYVDTMASGQFPYWDPYLIGGTPFYPNVPLHGMLDPAVLIAAVPLKLTGVSLVTLYNYFRIFKLLIVAIGAYLFYHHITKHRLGSLLAASILFFVFPLNNFRQFGTVDALYLTPFASYFLLKFVEDPAGPKRYLFLSLTALVSGISMINYIPVFYLFNVLVLVICAFMFRVASLREVAQAFTNKRFVALVAVLAIAVVMMASPPVTTLLNDASGNGELFPMQRIIQKNAGDFKQMVASDVGTNNLSNQFTNQLAPMNSWGEIVNFLFPDLVTFRYWGEHDLQSEADHYIGIIPLVLCMLGIIFVKSRYKKLLIVMVLINFVNGFSPWGYNNQPYNFIQKLFNAVFPPLTWYQGRNNLGYFVLFYLCAFAAIGFKAFFSDETFIHGKWRFIAILSAFFIVCKLVIAGYFARVFVATSTYDAFVLAQLAALIIGITLFSKGKITHQVIAVVATILIIMDLCAYNENAKEYSIQDSAPYHQLSDIRRGAGSNHGDFQYFREPFLSPGGPAFAESVAKIKGSLSAGYNHSLFTTKRFYDFFTNVPLDTQFIVDGIVHPIVQFWPDDRVNVAEDRRALLNLLTTIEPALLAQTLYIERPGITEPKKEFGDLSLYPSAPWLRPQAIYSAYSQFMKANSGYVRNIRENLDRFMQTPRFSLRVSDFSVNRTVVRVSTSVNGYLYYGDGWSRYWKAFDNNREIPVNVANYNFKAVFLSAGDHEVRFEFNPSHYKAALLAYYAGLVIIVTLILLLSLRLYLHPKIKAVGDSTGT